MPNLLDEVIVDAKLLKETALENAKRILLEKRNDEVNRLVESILEQEFQDNEEDDAEMPNTNTPMDSPEDANLQSGLKGAELDMGAAEPTSPVSATTPFTDQVPPLYAAGQKLCTCPDNDEPIDIDFDAIQAQIRREEQQLGLDAYGDNKYPELEQPMLEENEGQVDDTDADIDQFVNDFAAELVSSQKPLNESDLILNDEPKEPEQERTNRKDIIDQRDKAEAMIDAKEDYEVSQDDELDSLLETLAGYLEDNDDENDIDVDFEAQKSGWVMRPDKERQWELEMDEMEEIMNEAEEYIPAENALEFSEIPNARAMYADIKAGKRVRKNIKINSIDAQNGTINFTADEVNPKTHEVSQKQYEMPLSKAGPLIRVEMIVDTGDETQSYRFIPLADAIKQDSHSIGQDAVQAVLSAISLRDRPEMSSTGGVTRSTSSPGEGYGSRYSSDDSTTVGGDMAAAYDYFRSAQQDLSKRDEQSPLEALQHLRNMYQNDPSRNFFKSGVGKFLLDKAIMNPNDREAAAYVKYYQDNDPLAGGPPDVQDEPSREISAAIANKSRKGLKPIIPGREKETDIDPETNIETPKHTLPDSYYNRLQEPKKQYGPYLGKMQAWVDQNKDSFNMNAKRSRGAKTTEPNEEAPKSSTAGGRTPKIVFPGDAKKIMDPEAGVRKRIKEQDDALNEQKQLISTLKNEVVGIKELLEKQILINVRLVHINEALSNNSFNELQRKNLVESLNKAQTVEEMKLVFETIRKSVGSNKETVNKMPQSLNEVTSKVKQTILLQANKINDAKPKPEDAIYDRWGKIAGIKK